MPSGDKATVRTLERNSQACKIARAGDNVTVTLQGVEASSVTSGGVLCHPDFPVAVAKHLELKILTLEYATPILIGSQVRIPPAPFDFFSILIYLSLSRIMVLIPFLKMHSWKFIYTM